MNRNDPCWCGSGKKFKKCHGRSQPITMMKKPNRKLQIMDAEKLPKMRRACKLAANILKEVCGRVEAGMTTQMVDDWVKELTLDAGAYPAPLNYPNGQTDPLNPKIAPGAFPRSVCTSVNEVVCHGIPSDKVVLKDGDIMNIDVTVNLDGFFGDNSRTIFIGEPSKEARFVTESARESMELGIQAVKPGGRTIDIGRAIYAYATKKGLGVVRDYTGHGVGEVFHADPQICHYPSREMDCPLVPNMTFTIEPMLNLGTHQTVLDPMDKWTVYTLDRKLSAQFEHTVMVTDTGVEILTIPD